MIFCVLFQGDPYSVAKIGQSQKENLELGPPVGQETKANPTLKVKKRKVLWKQSSIKFLMLSGQSSVKL